MWGSDPNPDEWDLEVGPEFYPADYETDQHMIAECGGHIAERCAHPNLCKQLEALAGRVRRMNWTPDTVAALIVATAIQARDIVASEPDKPRRISLWEATGFVQAKVGEVSDGRGLRVLSLTFVATAAGWNAAGPVVDSLDQNTVNDMVAQYLAEHEQNNGAGSVFPLAWEG